MTIRTTSEEQQRERSPMKNGVTILTDFTEAERDRIFAAVDAEKLKRTNAYDEITVGFGLEKLFQNCEDAIEGSLETTAPEDLLPRVIAAKVPAGGKPRLLIAAVVNWRGNLVVEAHRKMRVGDLHLDEAPEWKRGEASRILWIRDVGKLDALIASDDPEKRRAASVAYEFVGLAFAEVVKQFAEHFDVSMMHQIGVEYGQDGLASRIRFLDPTGIRKARFDEDLRDQRSWAGFSADEIWNAQHGARGSASWFRAEKAAQTLYRPDGPRLQDLEQEFANCLKFLDEAIDDGFWSPADPTPIRIDNERDKEEIVPYGIQFKFPDPEKEPEPVPYVEDPEVIGFGDMPFDTRRPPPEPKREPVPPARGRKPAAPPPPPKPPTKIGFDPIMVASVTKFAPLVLPRPAVTATLSPRASSAPTPSSGGLAAIKKARMDASRLHEEEAARLHAEEAARLRAEEARLQAERADRLAAQALERKWRPDYSGLPAANWSSEYEEEFGAGSTEEFVALLNLHRKASGRLPVPHGGFPTSTRILNNLFKEARSTGMVQKVEGPKPG
ncbi:hypothetical protein [Bosea sp. ANAM02]|uniref:hypothetical protein n=1 Tax=Bosea sp. ANAM02 TaxID=2020412 RepID=UPI00140F41DD|nr:hypothetical protein [Bosea sp. ANAM02]BCB21989.1 hypothetical protein OCUBac02_48830 [Bosea sp. ANAM02]